MDFLKNWFFGKSTNHEAFNRFILPQVKRAKEAGLSNEIIDKLVKDAIDESDGQTRFPGQLLRDKIDKELSSR